MPLALWRVLLLALLIALWIVLPLYLFQLSVLFALVLHLYHTVSIRLKHLMLQLLIRIVIQDVTVILMWMWMYGREGDTYNVKGGAGAAVE
jgi:hypothetical protein